jgi:hypothetical protein
MVLWPELIQTREAYIYVDDEGYTLMDDSQPANCSIGISIDKEEFLRRMLNSLLEQNFEKSLDNTYPR